MNSTSQSLGFIIAEILFGENIQPCFREDERLMIFGTEELAEQELTYMLEGVKDAVKNGDMSEAYNREDYVIIPLTEVDSTGDIIRFNYEGQLYQMTLTDEDAVIL